MKEGISIFPYMETDHWSPRSVKSIGFSRKAPDVAILQITGIGFFLHVTVGLLKLRMNDGVI